MLNVNVRRPIGLNGPSIATDPSFVFRLDVLMRPAAASLTRVLAQTGAEAVRMREAGTVDAQVAGNLKFDLALNPLLLVPPIRIASIGGRAGAGHPAGAVAGPRNRRPMPELADVWLGDSIGEMPMNYAMAGAPR